MIEVKYGQLSDEAFPNYMQFLIGQFFKILGTFEDFPDTLTNHLESLKIEMLGSQELCRELKVDAQFIRLLNTIQFFIASDTEIQHKDVKREVFKAISIIEKLQKKYGIERSD